MLKERGLNSKQAFNDSVVKIQCWIKSWTR